MTLEDSEQAVGLHEFREVSEPRTDPVLPGHARSAKAAAPQLLLPDGSEIPASFRRDATGNPQPKADQRRGLLRRHPFAVPFAGIVLRCLWPVAILYWDDARHFETTDDAFIAARQFAIAPKVSGYITAVPVTDNQHVAAGDVIARIDDRDYRIALDQAQAQVAAAQASIENIDAQTAVQQAQIGANRGAGGAGAGQRWYSRSSRRRATRTLAHDGCGHRSERPAIQLAAASAAGGAEDCASNARSRAAAARRAEGAAQQRGGEPRAGQAQRDQAAAQPFLHDRHRRPARTRRQPLAPQSANTRSPAPTSPCSCRTRSGSPRTSRKPSSTPCGPGSR